MKKLFFYFIIPSIAFKNYKCRKTTSGKNPWLSGGGEGLGEEYKLISHANSFRFPRTVYGFI